MTEDEDKVLKLKVKSKRAATLEIAAINSTPGTLRSFKIFRLIRKAHKDLLDEIKTINK